MRRFANLADAGRQLAAQVVEQRAELDADAAATADAPLVVLAAIPNGVPVALPVAAALGARALALPVERSDAGPVVGPVPPVEGASVLVVDDGVETGAVARAAAAAIRPLRPATLVLAVPVCPHEAMADLGQRYDRVIAVERPFGRRALGWHFDDFDTIDPVRAMSLLQTQG